jgi:PhoH-like ATPase
MAAITQSPKKATPPKSSKKRTEKVKTKIHVLDTCVLLYDHSALNNFEENQIAIPITVLEELDNFKVGNETKNFEARESIRIIDRLSKDFTLQEWIPW